MYYLELCFIFSLYYSHYRCVYTLHIHDMSYIKCNTIILSRTLYNFENNCLLRDIYCVNRRYRFTYVYKHSTEDSYVKHRCLKLH